MKRDLDLCRRLLADIEGHGPDCAVTALRPGVTGEAEETVRYHVRLLIDAGLVKEVDRATGGVPCVRLTNAGHELLELAHSEARWREAKWVVGQSTGGQSLAVVRQVLARWACESALYGDRQRTRRWGYRPYHPASSYRPYRFRGEPRYRFEREAEADEPREPGLNGRYPSDYIERFDWRWPVDWRDAAERDAYYHDPLSRDWDPIHLDGASLPTHVV
ncbi:DUF2513 domain-containing protein [Botrimarina sp.]|uniref:DUF2513 domain-containing protein n=1 Tax=Botrimarina sp. TaxID=2795802 RepID=UPI0032EB9446